MNYSYYQDEKGEWRWRMLAAEGTVLMESGAGYRSEQECLDAIKRISASSNGHSVTRELSHVMTVPVVTTVVEPLPATKPAAKGTSIEAPASIHASSTVVPSPAGAPATNPDKSKNSEPEATAPPGIATRKDPEGPREAAHVPAVANDSKPADVACMLGESAVASVFTTKDNQLRWKYRANGGVVPETLHPAVDEFDSIMATIAVSVPKPYQRDCYHRLGKALFSALHAQGQAKPTSQFHSVRFLVRSKAKERARLVYVVASLAVTMLLALVILPLFLYVRSPEIKLIALGGCFGSIGACISVLQRNPSLDIDPWMSNGYLKLQGITRIILGFIFGCIFVLASKANFVLGVVRDNPYPLLVVCIVAGFSERLIPELLSKFESGNSVSPKRRHDDADE